MARTSEVARNCKAEAGLIVPKSATALKSLVVKLGSTSL